MRALYIIGSVAVVYMVVGVMITQALRYTPYRDNPKWTMVLLWPWYLYDLLK